LNDFTIFAERERAGWSDTGIVGSYVEKFGPITDDVAKTLVQRATAKGKDVLDLCCGQGALTAMLIDAGANTFGIDFSQEMLAIAKIAAPGAELKQADAAELPFNDSSFDLVICNFGMMHLPDQPTALAEIHRVLRPDGQFMMATWATPENSPAFGTVFGSIKAHADFSAAPPQPDLFTFARPDEATTMMSGAALKMLSHDTVLPAWHLSTPEELFEIFLNATVGASMLIKSQKPEVVEAIRDQITSTVAEKFAKGGGFRVPVAVSVVIASPS
jgi:SAM-dependent methyltransferase